MKRFALALAALVVVAIPAGAGTSGATFVASTANNNSTFATAADFNTVSVALTDPGSPLHGTVTLAATAASDRGISSVKFQTAPAGTSTWTDVCTASTAPFSCSFDTTTVADGLRDVRAVATDAAGYSRTASVASRRVDNTAPTTSLTDPGSPRTGTVSLSATASDAGSGLATLTLQYRASGASAWTDICQKTSSPANCNLPTVADGLYDLRSVATDAGGNSATSVVSSRRIDNTAPSITVVDPGAAVRGTVNLQSTSSDGTGSGVVSIKYQFRPASTGVWVDACTTTTAPFDCAGDTTLAPDGLYDVRAVATDAVGLSTTSATLTGRIDNTAPSSASMTSPAANLSGTVTLNGSGADAGSGIASLRFEYAPAGTSTWTTACTDSASPYTTCSWNTTGVSDALYDMRVVAVDGAGNSLASATITNRRVDNNGPTVTMNDPGSPLRGTLTVSASASDPAGVASVTIQRKLSSGSTWVDICTDYTSSYSCSWATSGNSAYDLRAVAVDSLGHSTTSAVVASRQVDNTAPTGTDVQVANGGTAHKMDAGDTLTFTWSEQMAPASIMSGWSGSQANVTVKVANAGSGGNSDTLTVWNASGTTQLNITGTSPLALQANRTSSSVATFNATMTQSGASVTIRLTSLASGTASTATKSSAMSWTPSASATDLAGNACATTVVGESSPSGKDF